MRYAVILYLSLSSLVLFCAICGISTATASDGEQDRAQTLSEQLSAGNIHLFAHVGYGPPVFDLDAYDAGGLSFNLGAQYLFVRSFGAGPRVRLTRLLLQSDSVSAYLTNIQIAAGWYATRVFQLNLAAGATVASSFSYGEIVSEPSFSMALGLSWTAWQAKYVGLELGMELDAMFDNDFKFASWESGVAIDHLFVNFLLYAGVRFSLGFLNSEKENRQ